MGGMISKSTTTHEKHSTHSTVAPVSHHPVTTVRCSEACPIQNNLEHLILAFFAGVLLTLLLLALVFLFLKSYRKPFIFPGGTHLCQNDFQSFRKKEPSLDCKLFRRLRFRDLFSSYKEKLIIAFSVRLEPTSSLNLV
ncbi:transmembrane protein C1orf162 homolog isoform X2 [Sorex fumeus]|uniref:transmembrane protein C1orf162 homolog isoform X2 n=1 Tax=Sorex fumeus TaxID=62283 RepID=UPI0024ADB214|nr:transmembrane protein C1orf162 homolog isoform X2 [Sorex fumeus]